MTRWVYMTCLGVVLSLNSGVGHPDQQNASRKLINGFISFRRVSRTGTYVRTCVSLSLPVSYFEPIAGARLTL